MVTIRLLVRRAVQTHRSNFLMGEKSRVLVGLKNFGQSRPKL